MDKELLNPFSIPYRIGPASASPSHRRPGPTRQWAKPLSPILGVAPRESRLPRHARPIPMLPSAAPNTRPVRVRLLTPGSPLPRRARLPLPPLRPWLAAPHGSLAPLAQKSGIQTKKSSRSVLPSRLAATLPHSLHIGSARRHQKRQV
jgi:hypothetical protein